MRKLMFIVSLSIASVLFGQQEPMYTHYAFNTQSVNPAYAGSRNVLSVTALNRAQWLGMPGAPLTQNININTPLANNKLGAGLSFTNDKAGPTNTTGIFGDIAARIKFGPHGKLAVGMKVGMNFRNSQLAGLQTDQPNDPSFTSNVQSKVMPNLGFGVYYSNRKFYLGFGAPHLIKNKLDNNANTTERHFYAIAGGMFNLKKDGSIKMRPSAFLKIANGAKPQLDLTALIYVKDKFWVGPMFRTSDALGVLAGAKLTDQFSVGYSFDWSYGVNTGRYNGGSHELMLQYDFIFKQKGKIESPRYF